MNQTKIISINKEKIFILAQFALLMGISLVVPIFKNQLITGSAINAILFISTALIGLKAGILISLLPSLFAFSFGLLPAVLGPMIPFIILGNIILVFTFNLFKKRNYWLAVGLASFLKFIFLFSTSLILINLFLEKQTALKIGTVMMSWPQLSTALLGGVIAYLFIKKNN